MTTPRGKTAALMARIEQLERIAGICLCGGGPLVLEIVDAQSGAILVPAPDLMPCRIPGHAEKQAAEAVVIEIAKYSGAPIEQPRHTARAIEPSGADKAIESAPPALDIPAPQPEPLRAPEPLPAPAVPARAALLTLERTYRERPALQLPCGFCQCGDHRLYHGPVYDGRGALLPEGQNAGRCGARDCLCEAFQPATQATTEGKEAL